MEFNYEKIFFSQAVFSPTPKQYFLTYYIVPACRMLYLGFGFICVT